MLQRPRNRLNAPPIHVIAAALGAHLLAWPASAQPAQFAPLGFLPSSTWSEAYAVTPDGATVVGRCLGGTTRAFRWTAATGMQALGSLPGQGERTAWGISDDGSVIVGDSVSTGGDAQACRWNAAGEMQLLGGLAGYSSSGASGVSADGAVIVGGSYSSSNEAVFWTAGSVQGIGDLPGGDLNSYANAVSADGMVLAGSGKSGSGFEAFRWSAADGMQGLGDLPGGGFFSIAMSTNASGTVVVGWANGQPGPGAQAFRWTAAGGMRGLGMLPGATSSVARGINGDGAVVVGASPFFAGRAFIWTVADGMVDLQAHLLGLGATGLSGWTLEVANAISANGRFIVGQGKNPAGKTEAWLAILPEQTNCPGDLDGDGAVNQADLALLLSCYGAGSCGDIDGDGQTGQSDLAALLTAYEFPC